MCAGLSVESLLIDVYGGKISGRNVQILNKIVVPTFGNQTFFAKLVWEKILIGSNCSTGCGGNYNYGVSTVVKRFLPMNHPCVTTLARSELGKDSD